MPTNGNAIMIEPLRAILVYRKAVYVHCHIESKAISCRERVDKVDHGPDEIGQQKERG